MGSPEEAFATAAERVYGKALTTFGEGINFATDAFDQALNEVGPPPGWQEAQTPKSSEQQNGVSNG